MTCYGYQTADKSDHAIAPAAGVDDQVAVTVQPARPQRLAGAGDHFDGDVGMRSSNGSQGTSGVVDVTTGCDVDSRLYREQVMRLTQVIDHRFEVFEQTPIAGDESFIGLSELHPSG